MSDDRIMTLHPEGKQGVLIDAGKYQAMREAIIASLKARGGHMAFSDLIDEVPGHLDEFDGSLMWYITTVKLDLEGRGVIKRVPHQSPQQITLNED